MRNLFIVLIGFSSFNAFSVDFSQLQAICSRGEKDLASEVFKKYFYVKLSASVSAETNHVTLSPADFDLAAPLELKEKFTKHCTLFDDQELDDLIFQARTYLRDEIVNKYRALVSQAQHFTQQGTFKGHENNASFILEVHNNAQALIYQAAVVLAKHWAHKQDVYAEVYSGDDHFYMDYLSYKILTAIGEEARENIVDWGQAHLEHVYFRSRLMALILGGYFSDLGLKAIERDGVLTLSCFQKDDFIPFKGWEPFGRKTTYNDMLARDQNLARITKPGRIIEMGMKHFPPLVISQYESLKEAIRQTKNDPRGATNVIPSQFFDKLLYDRDWSIKAEEFYRQTLAPYALKEDIEQQAFYFMSKFWEYNIQSSRPLFEVMKTIPWDISLHSDLDINMMSFTCEVLKLRLEAFDRHDVQKKKTKKNALLAGGACVLGVAIWGLCSF